MIAITDVPLSKLMPLFILLGAIWGVMAVTGATIIFYLCKSNRRRKTGESFEDSEPVSPSNEPKAYECPSFCYRQ